jgi:hypothetical protein
MVRVLETDIGAGNWLVAASGTTTGLSTCELTDGTTVAASGFGVGSIVLVASIAGPRHVELRCGTQSPTAHVMYCLCELDYGPAGRTVTSISTFRIDG